jgi:hypothetical protein
MEVVPVHLSHGLEEDRQEVGNSLTMILEEGLMVVDTLLHVAVASCRTMLVEVQEEAGMKAVARFVVVVDS